MTRGQEFEAAFVRLAWVPVVVLALQAMLWRPMTQTLEYAFIIPLLLTCIVSLFFGIVFLVRSAVHLPKR